MMSENMKLWIANYYMTDCGDIILGIYDNEEDAILRIKKYKQEHEVGPYHEGVFVSMYELNQEYDESYDPIILSAKQQGGKT